METQATLRLRLHIFFGLEGLGDCLGNNHSANDETFLCVRASKWAADPLQKLKTVRTPPRKFEVSNS